MNPNAAPPVVAAAVAAVISGTRRLPALLIELPARTPPAELVSLYTQGGRFVAFVLVYGLLFGAAYLAGARRGHPASEGTVVLATGLAAALGHLIGIGAVVQIIGLGGQDWVPVAVFWLGASVAVGVQLAVVTFAGFALARR